MTAEGAIEQGRYGGGPLPTNVVLSEGTLVTGERAFKRFHSRRTPALVIGRNCTIDNVQFALGEEATVAIGDHCYLSNVVMLAELEVVIGSYVVIGWNATIADTDFHPIAPAERIADAIALSPLSEGRDRPPIERRRVVIEDDVWIGPNAAVLKGVTIGQGAWIEPGSVVTRDVRPGSRVLGNPAHEAER